MDKQRGNQTLAWYIRCFTSFDDDWVSLLPLAEFAYNNAINSATGQSLFFANYGFHLSFLPDFVSESSVPAIQSTMEFLNVNNRILQEAVANAQLDNKWAFDKKRRKELNLQSGDRVWLSTTHLRLACPSKKLAPKFVGPFPVRRKLNGVSYELSFPDLFINPVFFMCHCLNPRYKIPFLTEGLGLLNQC